MDDVLDRLAIDLLDRALDDEIDMTEAAWRARVVAGATTSVEQREAVASAVATLVDQGLVTFDQVAPRAHPETAEASWDWIPIPGSGSDIAARIRGEWEAPQSRRGGRLLPGAIGWLRITATGLDKLRS